MCNPTAVRPHFSVTVQRALLVQMAVAEVWNVELGRIGGCRRGDPRCALARQTAMYLCRLVFNMKVAQIGVAFGRDRKTVRHAVRRIEELREDYEFDRTLTWLEASLNGLGGRP